MVLDFDRFCMGCMSCETEEGKPCPNCGFDEASYSPAPHILPLRTILNGKYLLGRTIGQGGFGILYLGWDLNLDMKLAIKEYYPDGFVTRDCHTATTLVPYAGEAAEFFADGLGKFIGEAKRLAKFYSLPGIVSVRDYFRENGTAYIIMEFIEGQTLKDYLAQKGGRLSPEEVLERFRPLMDALAEVHAHDIIHRDISPDNIMMDKAGHFRLIDFGAAREFGGKGSQTILLKPGYAPYEQYQSDGEKQGPWTDVYALCATLYRCITGEVPVEASKRLPEDILKPPSSILGVRVSPELEAALMKGLAIFQGQRWQNIGEFQAALDAIPKPDPDPKPKPKPDPKPKPKPKPKPDTPREPRENPLSEALAAIRALPPRTLKLAAGGCAALVLLVLLLPRLLGGVGIFSARGPGSPGPSSTQGSSGTSLAVPPADEWRDPGQTPGQSGSELQPAANLRQPDDPAAVVRLSDWALEYHLRNALDKPEGDFTAGELAQIQRLHIWDITCTVNTDPPPKDAFSRTVEMPKSSGLSQVPHVSDLSDLKYFINLRDLTLTNQELGELSGLLQLPELTGLNIGGNGSEGMDYSPLASLTSLERLELREMRYDSLTDLSFVKGLTKLRELVLRDNDALSDLSPLAGLTGLERLDLFSIGEKPKDTKLDLTPLAKLKNLRELDLSFCETGSLTPLAALTGLEVLNLRYCNATYTFEDSSEWTDLTFLSGFDRLRELDLGYCVLVDLSPLSGLTSLEKLDLHFAKVGKNKDFGLSPLSSLTELRELDISYCNVKSLAPLAGMKKLEALTMKVLFSQAEDPEWVRIRDLSPLAGMTQLRELTLEHLDCQDLSVLGKLDALEILELSDCGIKDISVLQNLSGLKQLDLYGNEITDLSALSNLSGLKELALGSNRIADLSPLSGLSGLEHLNLESNQIKSLDGLEELTGLTYLNVGKNQIVSLAPIAKAEKLKYFYGSDNQITSLDALSGKPALTSVGAENNRVADLSPLSDLPEDAYLSLDGNDISDWSPVAHVTTVYGRPK